MNKLFLTGLLCAGMFPLLTAQQRIQAEPESRRCITVGFLQGGGSLVGADFEVLLAPQFGFQLGAGFVGFGAGLNYHFKPSIRSSFLSLQYWHQGFGETYTQSVLGPSFVFRARKIFTIQAGLGFPLEEGPGWTDEFDQPPVMLTYAIGVYFPLM